MPEPLAKKVLLIGWDAADWKVATPLLEQGLMPALDDFINHGVMGNLATLQPILSPMLWNSIATGKRADKHGIHGCAEPDPNSGGVRPVTSTSRKAKAIWNILTQKGYKTHVLGWSSVRNLTSVGWSIITCWPAPRIPRFRFSASWVFPSTWPLCRRTSILLFIAPASACSGGAGSPGPAAAGFADRVL